VERVSEGEERPTGDEKFLLKTVIPLQDLIYPDLPRERGRSPCHANKINSFKQKLT